METTMGPYDLALERACDKRDAVVDRLLAMKDYRAGMPDRDRLLRYLIGHRLGSPAPIPQLLRDAQTEVLNLMANEVEPWRT